MHQKEMTPWHWTWVAWERVKYGSMGIALEDIGLLLLMETAVDAVILLHSGLQDAKLVAASQLKNGNKIFSRPHVMNPYRIES